MSRIHINIGSNLGDRAAHIERAVAAVSRRLDPEGQAVITVAPLVESPPWGYSSPLPYLNAGLMVDTPLRITSAGGARRILAALLEVERGLCAAPHRNADGTYADRAIDIDLIAIDTLTVNDTISAVTDASAAHSDSPDACGTHSAVTDASAASCVALTLPHPRMHLRRFVLGPMHHLDPSWRHPLLGLTPSGLLATLTTGEE